jgi:hypothetical protein
MAALFFGLAVFLTGCAADDPEARLRETIEAMEAAVEARAPGDFIEYVSDDFGGGEGLDRRGLRGLLAGQLIGSQQVEVVLGPLDVTLHGGERATVVVDALVMGGRWLPERGERIEITSGWRLEDGQWRCYTATWKR